MVHPYTMTKTSQPSFASNLLYRLENALVYMGYVVGIILLFENFLKMINGEVRNSLVILFTALLLWWGGFISRIYFTKSWAPIKAGYDTAEKFRVETLYFLFAFTFTAVFMTTFVRYIPVYAYSTEFERYALIQDYINGKVIISLVLNLSVLFVFLLGLVALTEYLFSKFFLTQKYGPKSGPTIQFAKLFLLGLMIFFSFIFGNIPFVKEALAVFFGALNGFFVNNMSWLVDYALVFPIFYYLVANFKGSLLAEKFSAYRKVIF